ncbi:hypothetical protein CgunFtcFv8_024232 [Champsocephalus gunnari]|uniref:Uncharacterized protein n=1 Tax=Champsocephalus gunnari TaxID=52237 RepID=A0AAN8DDX7_CHAGU|nr:hypothetical protein CgunFtcFv8_024232 [Champsocephalus gunnari]
MLPSPSRFGHPRPVSANPVTPPFLFLFLSPVPLHGRSLPPRSGVRLGHMLRTAGTQSRCCRCFKPVAPCRWLNAVTHALVKMCMKASPCLLWDYRHSVRGMSQAGRITHRSGAAGKVKN